MRIDRLNELEQYIITNGTVSMDELVQHFNVSINTIRRDIAELLKRDHIKKVYGGVCLASGASNMASLGNWNERLGRCHNEKVRIATRALEMISDSSVIALDIGTTTYELSRLLVAKHDLSIITNSLTIASELARSTPHKIYCIGGVVVPSEIVTSGMFARQFLSNFASIDLFIGSADGIAPTRGITECSEEVIEVKRQLISRAERHIALIDHSKFGKVGLFEACPIEDINVLITDEQTPQAAIEQLQKRGVDVVIAR